jgi:hypothetical protein
VGGKSLKLTVWDLLEGINKIIHNGYSADLPGKLAGQFSEGNRPKVGRFVQGLMDKGFLESFVHTYKPYYDEDDTVSYTAYRLKKLVGHVLDADTRTFLPNAN